MLGFDLILEVILVTFSETSDAKTDMDFGSVKSGRRDRKSRLLERPGGRKMLILHLYLYYSVKIAFVAPRSVFSRFGEAKVPFWTSFWLNFEPQSGKKKVQKLEEEIRLNYEEPPHMQQG